MNTKYIKVLKYIMDFSPTTLTEVSTFFSITERNLRYQIEKINEFLKDTDLKSKIFIKKGQIQIDQINYLKENLKGFEIDISTLDRKFLLALIILLNENCNLSKLAKSFNLTRNSLKNSLSEVKKLFFDFNLELKFNHNDGYYIVGKEEEIRKIQFEILYKYFFEENLTQENVVNLLNSYFSSDLKKQVNIFLKNLEISLNICLNDRNYKIIFLYLIIGIKRIENNNNFLQNINNEFFLKSTNEFLIFQKDFDIFQKNLKKNIPYFDKLKIFEIVLGCCSLLEEQDYLVDWISLELKIKRIIELSNKSFNIDFFKDQYLYKDLINHIKPMLYRTSNGFSIHNDELEEFKIQNNNFFSTIESILKQEFPFVKWSKNNEGVFIAIHFKVAFDRISQFFQNRKNILIVCNFGYGTGKLIGNQIVENFDVNLMKIVSLKELMTLDLNNIDYIITTLKLDDFKNISFKSSNIIQVKPILNNSNLELFNKLGIKFSKKQHDITKIIEIINKYSTVNDNINLKNELNLFLNKSFIDYNSKFYPIEKNNFFRIEKNAIKIKEAIIKATQPLIDNNFIDCLYLEQMLKIIKTNLDYIILENGIIIPDVSIRCWTYYFVSCKI